MQPPLSHAQMNQQRHAGLQPGPLYGPLHVLGATPSLALNPSGVYSHWR